MNSVFLEHAGRSLTLAGPPPWAAEIWYLIPASRSVPSSLKAGFIDLLTLMGAGRKENQGNASREEVGSTGVHLHPQKQKPRKACVESNIHWGSWRFVPSFSIRPQHVAIFNSSLILLDQRSCLFAGQRLEKQPDKWLIPLVINEYERQAWHN